MDRPDARADGAQPHRPASHRAPRARASTTTSPRAMPAAPTSCASRTPTRPARTADFERDIIDNLHWLGISWDEGPQVAGGEEIGPFAPYRQSARMELYAREADRLVASGRAYRCWCSPEELEAVRREQEAAKEPPRYNRRCLNLTDAERAAFEARGPHDRSSASRSSPRWFASTISSAARSSSTTRSSATS